MILQRVALSVGEIRKAVELTAVPLTSNPISLSARNGAEFPRGLAAPTPLINRVGPMPLVRVQHAFLARRQGPVVVRILVK